MLKEIQRILKLTMVLVTLVQSCFLLKYFLSQLYCLSIKPFVSFHGVWSRILEIIRICLIRENVLYFDFLFSFIITKMTH